MQRATKLGARTMAMGLAMLAVTSTACTVVRAGRPDGDPVVSGRVIARQATSPGADELEITAVDWRWRAGTRLRVQVPASARILGGDGRVAPRARVGDEVLVWSAAEPVAGAPIVATAIVTSTALAQR